MRSAKLEGRWTVTAYLPGKGNYVGEMTIEPGTGADEFTTKVKLQSVKDGTVLQRTGRGLVYGGYAWRGRSKGAAAPGTSPDDLMNEMREALWISPDQTSGTGRLWARAMIISGRRSGGLAGRPSAAYRTADGTR